MPRPHRSDPLSCLRSRSAAMPIFTYFAVAGSVLIALLFVADATLEKDTPAVVTSQYGLPKRPVVTSDQYGLEKPWRPKTQKQILAAVPAPAPDMTSPLVLAAQPKAQSVPEVLANVEPAALAARAEAPPKKRVTGRQPPVDNRQKHTWSQHLPGSREFGLSGSY